MKLRKVPTPMFAALKFVMARLDRAIFLKRAIHLSHRPMPARDGPVKPGHDERVEAVLVHSFSRSLA